LAHNEVDFLTRYFLRKLAVSRRKYKHSLDPLMPFRDAKTEVILVFMALPVAAVFMMIAILALHWITRAQMANVHLPPKLLIAVVLWGLCLFWGNKIFDRRLSRFREDPSASDAFDTERDRRVLRWQFVIAIATAGLVVPVLSFVALYLMS
jgi:uncharacterized membrane protein YbhN (UPF0104 family)